MKTCRLLALLVALAVVLVAEAASSSPSSSGGSIGIDLTPNKCTKVTLPGVSWLRCETECDSQHPGGIGYCTPKPSCECAYDCYQPQATDIPWFGGSS